MCILSHVLKHTCKESETIQRQTERGSRNALAGQSGVPTAEIFTYQHKGSDRQYTRTQSGILCVCVCVCVCAYVCQANVKAIQTSDSQLKDENRSGMK